MRWGSDRRGAFGGRRRPLELAITPLIDIVFLLLIFFMLTSRFVVQEGIEIDLPVTEKPHSRPSEEMRVLQLLQSGAVVFQGRTFTLDQLGVYLGALGEDFMSSPFEIQADRRASVQSVVSLLELLRDRGASRVSMGTVSGPPEKGP